MKSWIGIVLELCIENVPSENDNINNAGNSVQFISPRISNTYGKYLKNDHTTGGNCAYTHHIIPDHLFRNICTIHCTGIAAAI
jgi:hypothetical protein